MSRGKRYFVIVVAVLISFLAYGFLIRYVERHETLQLIFTYIILFGSYAALLFFGKDLKVGWLLAAGVLFRLLFLMDMPALSDDIFRFVWDGRLLLNGIEPFAQLPSYYMQAGSPDVPGITTSLFAQLNSPDYYTVYPPIAQDIFWIAVSIFPNSILGSAMVMRIFIIMAECGSMWLLLALLKGHKMDLNKSLIYILNPLVIIELTGNLHFEGIMIFFLLLSIYFFDLGKLWPSALFMALAISTKLIPLIFLPIFFRYLPWKKCMSYYGMILLFTVLIFMPMARPDLITGMSNSLSLYFEKFEFNASIYYLIRYVGFKVVGYNIIGMTAKVLPLVTLLAVLTYTFVHKYNQITPAVLMWCLVIYLLLSTTIHPWYITPLLALSVFSNYRFVLVWSFFIFLSYVGYTKAGFQENLWFTGLEYVMVALYLIYESYFKDRIQFSFRFSPKKYEEASDHFR